MSVTLVGSTFSATTFFLAVLLISFAIEYLTGQQRVCAGMQTMQFDAAAGMVAQFVCVYAEHVRGGRCEGRWPAGAAQSVSVVTLWLAMLYA
jgi:hypothetical protein